MSRMSNKEQFIKIMEQVERPGVDKLLDRYRCSAAHRR